MNIILNLIALFPQNEELHLFFL